MKPTIGIPAFQNEAKTSFGCGSRHLQWVSQFGNAKLLMPWETCDTVQIDALYLPGGMDLNPAVYGEVPEYRAGNQDVHKQFFYDHRLAGYINAGTPVFGVCLGFQMICTFFGAKLVQDAPFHPQSKDRFRPGHKITAHNDWYNDQIILGEAFEVNSHHHQLVLAEDESFPHDQLAIKSVCADSFYGVVVEGVRHRGLRIAGVQHHPEEWYDGFSAELFRSILNS